MRIDLTRCGFKLCRRCFDGNCTGSEADRTQCKEFAREQQLNNGWIPVASGILPEISEEKLNEGYVKKHVLVYIDKEPRTRIAWFDVEDQKFYDDYTMLGLTVKVSHWRYLPEEPFKEAHS